MKEQGINVRVIDCFSIKPIDKEMVLKCAKETKKIITIEDHSVIGGLGSAVCEIIAENCIGNSEYMVENVTRMGIKDTFGESGKAEDLMKKYKIDSNAIIECVK